MSNIDEMEALKMKLSRIAKESPTYEKLAYYIEKNYMRIVFMTASEVASEMHISQGSVSRFCIALGYHGYNDFLRGLQQYVSTGITAPQRLQYTLQDDVGDKNANIVNNEMKNIGEIGNIVTTPQYARLVKAVAGAPEVILLSARMSATLLPYVGYILNKIRGGVWEVTPQIPLWDTLSLRDKEKTLVFCVIFPRYPKVLLAKLDELHRAGFRIAAITDSLISPVPDFADLVLQIPITVSSIFDIYSTPMLFLNLLMRDVAREIEGLDVRLGRIEKMETDLDIYYRKN